MKKMLVLVRSRVDLPVLLRASWVKMMMIGKGLRVQSWMKYLVMLLLLWLQLLQIGCLRKFLLVFSCSSMHFIKWLLRVLVALLNLLHSRCQLEQNGTLGRDWVPCLLKKQWKSILRLFVNYIPLGQLVLLIRDGDDDASGSASKGPMGPVFSSFAYEEESDNELKLEAIYASAREGEIYNLLKYTGSGVSVDIKDSEGRTALHWAVD